jgi:hypothetical protein
MEVSVKKLKGGRILRSSGEEQIFADELALVKHLREIIEIPIQRAISNIHTFSDFQVTFSTKEASFS